MSNLAGKWVYGWAYEPATGWMKCRIDRMMESLFISLFKLSAWPGRWISLFGIQFIIIEYTIISSLSKQLNSICSRFGRLWLRDISRILFISGVDSVRPYWWFHVRVNPVNTSTLKIPIDVVTQSISEVTCWTRALPALKKGWNSRGAQWTGL